MANLIFEGSDKIRTTQFSSSTPYDIGLLNFYILEKLQTEAQIFIIMKSQKGLYEIVELEKVSSNGTHVLYKVPVNQKIRIENEKVELTILILNKNGTYFVSKPISINITTEQYTMARQVYIAKEVSAEAQSCLAKILMLTEKMKGEIKE